MWWEAGNGQETRGRAVQRSNVLVCTDAGVIRVSSKSSCGCEPRRYVSEVGNSGGRGVIGTRLESTA